MPDSAKGAVRQNHKSSAAPSHCFQRSLLFVWWPSDIEEPPSTGHSRVRTLSRDENLNTQPLTWLLSSLHYESATARQTLSDMIVPGRRHRSPRFRFIFIHWESRATSVCSCVGHVCMYIPLGRSGRHLTAALPFLAAWDCRPVRSWLGSLRGTRPTRLPRPTRPTHPRPSPDIAPPASPCGPTGLVHHGPAPAGHPWPMIPRF